MLKEKRSHFKILSRPLAYIYTCVLCTHVQIHICRDSVHLDSSGPPDVLSRPLGSHPSTPCAVYVCVCGTHTHTPKYTSKDAKLLDLNTQARVPNYCFKS